MRLFIVVAINMLICQLAYALDIDKEWTVINKTDTVLNIMKKKNNNKNIYMLIGFHNASEIFKMAIKDKLNYNDLTDDEKNILNTIIHNTLKETTVEQAGNNSIDNFKCTNLKTTTDDVYNTDKNINISINYKCSNSNIINTKAIIDIRNMDLLLYYYLGTDKDLKSLSTQRLLKSLISQN